MGKDKRQKSQDKRLVKDKRRKDKGERRKEKVMVFHEARLYVIWTLRFFLILHFLL